MFEIYDDMSIYVTRGDTVFFSVSAEEYGIPYIFKKNEVVRIKVFEKKKCENVVLQKDFLVEEDTHSVNILLTTQETKIGKVISKPVDYWYEVELNPFTNPQTIIGYDDDGAKLFKLFPEGKDLVDEPTEEIPEVDTELDITSTRPVQNQAIARAVLGLSETLEDTDKYIKDVVAEKLEEDMGAYIDGVVDARIEEVMDERIEEAMDSHLGEILDSHVEELVNTRFDEALEYDEATETLWFNRG